MKPSLCYTKVYYIILYSILLYYTILYSSVLYCTMLYYGSFPKSQARGLLALVLMSCCKQPGTRCFAEQAKPPRSSEETEVPERNLRKKGIPSKTVRKVASLQWCRKHPNNKGLKYGPLISVLRLFFLLFGGVQSMGPW